MLCCLPKKMHKLLNLISHLCFQPQYQLKLLDLHSVPLTDLATPFHSHFLLCPTLTNAIHPQRSHSGPTSLWLFGSLVAQPVKNPPAMWETWVLSLGWEDPLEKGRATHSSILAWRIPWTIAHGVAKSRTRLSDFHFTSLWKHRHRNHFLLNFLSLLQPTPLELNYCIVTRVIFLEYEFIFSH